MSRSLRRGALAATSLVFSIATLAACGAGNNAQTLGVKPDDAATKIGNINVQDATVITQPTADAPGPAVVTGTVFNAGNTPQTLDSISLPGTSATVKLSPVSGSGPLAVPAHGSLRLGGKGNASAVIENGSEAAKNGDVQQVTFTFSDTGNVSLQALVTPAVSYFKGVGPSAPPAPTATPSDTGTPDTGTSDTGTPQGPGGTTTPTGTATNTPVG